MVSKQRNGPIGTAKLAFVDRFARFENLAHYYNPDEYVPPTSGGDGYDVYMPPSQFDSSDLTQRNLKSLAGIKKTPILKNRCF
ncbi:MAG TPA: hypothetical protein DIW24_10040 [Bacteroidetes bacterium]|nr:hypothetical protein [Bacteroidota bacterium]